MNPAQIGYELEKQTVDPKERPAEFMLNALRLLDGVPEALFEQRTGLALDSINEPLRKWRELGFMHPSRLALTPRGLLALDTITADFLAD